MGLLLFSCHPEDNPSVSTGEVTNITATTATCAGNVFADGGAAIIARGICWSTSQFPTISDSKTSNGNGLGIFTSNITSLSPNTTYYVRAYATNSVGTAYGEQKTFTTNVEQTLPTVTTGDISNITTTTADCSGNVTSDGGSSVTARGVCWSTSENPTTSDSKTTNGTGLGTYTSNITGISPNTTYYVRAYATNAKGTAYGEQKTFTTNAEQTTPTVTTGEITNITTTTADCSGNVTSDGGSSVTARGVCWRTSENPTTSDSKTTDGTGVGDFTSNLTGLSPSTTYYVKAYATNSKGTAYGEQKSFKTNQEEEGTTFTDSRDGIVYETVTIGEQVWMAENLAYLPSVVGPATGSTTDPHYYVYGYDGTNIAEAKATTNYQTYGVLYNWHAALPACPSGWHLPSDAEWKQLEMYLGMTQVEADKRDLYRGTEEGGKLKEAGTSHWKSPNTGATNESGFTALPGGYRTNNGSFVNVGIRGLWWSSTQYSTNDAWYRYLSYLYSSVYRYATNNEYGFSVRCVKGNEEQITPTVTTGDICNITTTTADCSGNVTSDGGSSVTARGVCWSTSENPTTSDSKTTDGTGVGTYTSNITGLSPYTTYYVRAYATNSMGTAYGEERSFITQEEQGPTFGNLTDSRDGKAYKTVTIGNQTWMAENLAYLPSVVGPATGSTTDPHYYVYGYDGTNVAEAKATTNYQTYGVLYNWPAAMNGASSSNSNPSGVQGICPEGWHLPSEAEWDILTDYLGGTPVAGGKMKEAGTSHWESPNTGATNESGFTALPGGNREDSGAFNDIGSLGYLWTSTLNPSSTHIAWFHILYYESRIISGGGLFKGNGYSVRCLRDNAEQTTPTVTTGEITNITPTTADCSGNVTSEGGSSVTTRGVCWSTSENPTTSDSKTTDGTGVGTYTSNITGLFPNTTYYVRAYATNDKGTAYGQQLSFVTQEEQGPTFGSLTDTRDGKAYKTVTIGNQTWMAENLAYLPSVVGPETGSEEGRETDPFYYVYGYDGTNVAAAKATTNYQTYGVLYNWHAALPACPPGWHLPSDAEWTKLENYLISNGYNYDGTTTDNKIALSLSATGWDYSSYTGTPGYTDYSEFRNKSGFSALPGGYRNDDDGDFHFIGGRGVWWSSTRISVLDLAYYRQLENQDRNVIRDATIELEGFSVRCVMNTAEQTTPTVTTGNVTNITPLTVRCSGDVTSDGGLSIIARGVCWSTSENPTTSNSKTTDGTDVGTYTSNITGLSPNTKYYARAYATNAKGTSYGQQRSFVTKEEQDPVFGSLSDSRDGKVYKTVSIGEQVWMAENLAYLPSVMSMSIQSNTIPYNYVYGYDGTDVAEAKATEEYKTYGVLYNWPSAMDRAASSDKIPSGVQGICPDGWHLPSDDEWTQLENYLIAYGYNYDGTTEGNKIAKSMASASGWNVSNEEGTPGNTDYTHYINRSGFSALPGGYRASGGSFFDIGYDGNCWSSTEDDDEEPWYRELSYNDSNVFRYSSPKRRGFSVRCVQDKD